MAELSVQLRVLSHECSIDPHKDPIISSERTAVHSGKLGDIIYALPTCRALGISHLVLNIYDDPGDPLRLFTYRSARRLVPLLLAQTYIKKVSISQCHIPLEKIGNLISGIDYNFDNYRNVPRHRLNYQYPNLHPDIIKFSIDHFPVHLMQCFGAALGVRVGMDEPWLEVKSSSVSKNTVVISLTKNWRSYQDAYWSLLLRDVGKVLFVGLPSEWEKFRSLSLKNCEYVRTENYLDLASVISGADLFLGTISFPYAIAEALKVKRAVEICHKNLNAFPVGPRGYVLPIDVMKARQLVGHLLSKETSRTYELVTKSMRMSIPSQLCRLSQVLNIRTRHQSHEWMQLLFNFLRLIRVHSRLRT
ncbi:MAG: hypothetical protein HY537_03315 [Deltaproteobacteria bacterium]|nr:hypothetical protein [Deltaproteobacteria bacterium]